MPLTQAVARLVAAAAVAALPMALPAQAPAATPLIGPYDIVDTETCPFPVRAVGGSSEKTHFRGNGGVLVTGKFTVTLTNLATGRSRVLKSSGPFTFDPTAGTFRLNGSQLAFSFTGVPIGELKGSLVLDAGAFRIVSQTGEQSPLDVCALLDPSLPRVASRTTPAPWGLPLRPLATFVNARTTPIYSALIKHHHVHLDVFVDGQPVTVPAGIGMVAPVDLGPEGFESGVGAIAPLHTHFPDGILHVEANSPLETRLTLGQFFDLWQVRLTRDCLGAYCSSGERRLRVYVNGVLRTGDPRQIELVGGDEVAVVFGVPGQPAMIPSSYAFPPQWPPVVEP